MSFVFLSYSRKDLNRASQLVKLLEKRNIDVFWDDSIRFGENHKTVIAERLESAGCVLVLWSEHSAKSHWVNYEATEGLERQTIVEARLDGVKPPPPFGVLNTADLRKWRGGLNSGDIEKLVESVTKKTRARTPGKAEMCLGSPRPAQSINDSHLALIHNCWRSPEWDQQFGNAEMYRWDIMLFGSKQALNRVEEVTYILHPAYDQPQLGSTSINRLHRKEHRETCFLLKQLANGHSLVRAHVKVMGQVEFVNLSRYINLFDTKDHLDAYLR